MLTLDIPGRDTLELEHLVLDVNGTIATDGRLSLGVVPRLDMLRRTLQIHLLTADTHGRQVKIDATLKLQAQIVTQGTQEKGDFVKKLGKARVVAMGNGVNDIEMFKQAALSIAVIGVEGAAGSLLREADVVVHDINHALDLLLYPDRLRATLRV